MFGQNKLGSGSFLRWFPLVLPVFLACSSSDSRSLHLLDKQTAPSTETEAQRLRKLQLVRVIDNSQTPPAQVDIDAGVLIDAAYYACHEDQCGAITDECQAMLCYSEGWLCQAKAMMAASLPQSTSTTIAQFTIPPQSTGAVAALTSNALGSAAEAAAYAGYPMDEMFKVASTNYYCQAGDATRNDSDGVPFATAYAAAYTDAFHTFEEVTNLSVKATIDASDAQFSSTNSLSTAVGRAIAGQSLSRTAAAHLLTNGDSGLLGSNTNGFCSGADLSPDGTAALSVFRDSALSPVDLLNSSLSITTLLDGVGTAVPGGSVRQRIADLYQYPALLTGTPVEQYYGLTLTAFSEARAFLQSEIKAFSRSLASTSTLPAKKLPGGTSTTYARYSATAGPPLPLPAAYYGAIARFTTSSGSPISNPPTDYGFDGLDRFIDASVSHAAQLLNAQAATGAVIPRDATGPLALLVASKERTARLTFTNSGTTASVTVDGFASTDGVRFLIGEDQLRCAVQGSIEGAACSNVGVAVATVVTPPPYGFSASTKLTAVTVPVGSTRVYIVRPKLGIAVATAGPGQFEALIGITVNTAQTNTFVVPVVPSIERQVADILEPNKDWCTHSKVSCAGTDFDERLPLENELSSDQDGVESSWKHYLQEAKDAAAQADSLGTDYINTGLQQTQNALDNEVRQEQQLERADDEIEKLQSICGTKLDPRTVLTWLSTGSTSANDIYKASGPACDPTVANTCTSGLYCTSIGQCAASGCGPAKGVCLVDLTKMAQDDTTGDPDLKRLADCISDQQLTQFVSLGKQPVCLWYSAANPNLVCQGGTGGQQCPVLTNQPCATALAPVPAGMTATSSTNVGFFDTTAGAVSAAVCSTFRTLRLSPGASVAAASGGSSLVSLLVPNYPFDQKKLAAAADRLTWEMRYGGYSSIDLDGAVLYETGNAFTTGPNTTTWPCSTAGMPPECTGTPTGAGLMCQHFDCTDPTARNVANYTMLRAVLAAKAIAHGGGILTLGQGLAYTNPSNNNDLWGSFASDSPTDLITYHDTGASVVRTFGPDGIRYSVTTTGGSDPAGIAWHTLGSKNPGYINQFKPNTIESQKLVAQGSGGSIPALKGFDELKYDGTDPWVVRRLSGLDNSDLRMQFSFGYRTSAAGATPVTAVLGFPDVAPVADLITEPGSNRLTANGEDALNGYELLCGVQQSDFAPTVSLTSPPTVTSVGDLTRVAKYIQLLSQTIKNQAATRVFSNIPSIAVTALQHAGTDGAYPQYSGQMGDALAKLRGGLTRLQETIPLLSNEVAGFGYDLQSLHDTLAINSNQSQIANLQMWSNVSNQLAACASTIGVGSLFSGATVATCANAIAQIAIGTKINSLTNQDNQLASAISTLDFGTKFSSHATNMQTLALHFAEASEDVDSSLATIEGLRADAKVSLARAMDLASFQAQNAAVATTVIGNLYDGKQIRYKQALDNAKRMAFLAKRAIEQRLGVRLSDLTEPLPLVDAPSTWEATGCTMTGVNYNSPDLSPDSTLTSAGGAQKFAEGFIGDYVTKLENVVESYQLVNNFHEGTDTAVISLRDDIMNVRAPCAVTSPNLLFYTSDLQQFGTPGWKEEGCTMQTVNSVQVPAANCVTVNNAGAIPPAMLPDPALANASAYLLKFGAGALATTKMDQTVALNSGTYRFSWYTPDVAGAAAGFVTAPAGVTQLTTTPTAQVANTWGRRFITFKVVSDGVTASQPVTLGFARLATTTASFTVAAPMLEVLPGIKIDYALAPFVGTTGTLTTTVPACQDTDGSVFRTSGWQVGCDRLCADGFSSQCDTSNAKSYCYHQASFGINQRDIQLGKVLNFSGFARGNFNYRIDSLAVNFVGTGTRDCSNSDSPTACSGGGFMPYSLEHVGPFYVRNYQGQDFRAQLFDGSIEHARGLSSERYITNPISSADQSLLDQYMRAEFQGRPLDGNFVMKVWDGDGSNFDAIQDVQLVLKYRYWTRFN